MRPRRRFSGSWTDGGSCPCAPAHCVVIEHMAKGRLSVPPSVRSVAELAQDTIGHSGRVAFSFYFSFRKECRLLDRRTTALPLIPFDLFRSVFTLIGTRVLLGFPPSLRDSPSPLPFSLVVVELCAVLCSRPPR